MLSRIVRHVRHNVIAYLALVFAVGAGGGYAIAATRTNTIHGCVNKRTHALYIQARCHRSQRPVVLVQGRQTNPVTAWAAVQANGFTGAGARGISVQRVSTGTYNLTATLSQCASVASAPVVTVDTANPPSGSASGAFPMAWEVHQGSGRNTFAVYTGVVAGGSFKPMDEAFNVQVPCA